MFLPCHFTDFLFSASEIEVSSRATELVKNAIPENVRWIDLRYNPYLCILVKHCLCWAVNLCVGNYIKDKRGINRSHMWSIRQLTDIMQTFMRYHSWTHIRAGKSTHLKKWKWKESTLISQMTVEQTMIVYRIEWKKKHAILCATEIPTYTYRYL